jgi:outer membrane protein OmpA-like peptidoglycan-associated protein
LDNKTEEGLRYSIIYEFNQKSYSIYEKYLTDVITPKIPVGATVIIHGHTDAIGEETYNQILSSSCKRCENIIENSLSKAQK